MRMVIRTAWFTFGLMASTAIAAQEQAIVVHAGESIQKAIDAAPAGATIRIDAGTFDERISITKTLTVRGAGWDKTFLNPTTPSAQEIAKAREALQKRFREIAATRPNWRPGSAELLSGITPPTLLIQQAKDVLVSDVQLSGPRAESDGNRTFPHALVLVTNAEAVINGCAVVGPFDNGIVVEESSTLEVRRTLVGGMWNVGIAVRRGSYPGSDSTLKLADSDVRNCYYSAITLASGSDSTEIRRSWISGTAWHGIRYDDASPTIEGNRIFSVARSGIYASGETHAKIANNVFYANEMDGISCWMRNADEITGNTFVGNLREQLSVLGGSAPRVERNVFANGPLGVTCNAIGGQDESVFRRPVLVTNLFWEIATPMTRGKDAIDLPETNSVAKVEFKDPAANDFTILDPTGFGAKDLIPAQSPWPIQPGEALIIPDGGGYGFQLWKTTKPQ